MKKVYYTLSPKSGSIRKHQPSPMSTLPFVSTQIPSRTNTNKIQPEPIDRYHPVQYNNENIITNSANIEQINKRQYPSHQTTHQTIHPIVETQSNQQLYHQQHQNNQRNIYFDQYKPVISGPNEMLYYHQHSTSNLYHKNDRNQNFQATNHSNMSNINQPNNNLNRQEGYYYDQYNNTKERGFNNYNNTSDNRMNDPHYAQYSGSNTNSVNFPTQHQPNNINNNQQYYEPQPAQPFMQQNQPQRAQQQLNQPQQLYNPQNIYPQNRKLNQQENQQPFHQNQPYFNQNSQYDRQPATIAPNTVTQRPYDQGNYEQQGQQLQNNNFSGRSDFSQKRDNQTRQFHHPNQQQSLPNTQQQYQHQGQNYQNTSGQVQYERFNVGNSGYNPNIPMMQQQPQQVPYYQQSEQQLQNIPSQPPNIQQSQLSNPQINVDSTMNQRTQFNDQFDPRLNNFARSNLQNDQEHQSNIQPNIRPNVIQPNLHQNVQPNIQQSMYDAPPQSSTQLRTQSNMNYSNNQNHPQYNNNDLNNQNLYNNGAISNPYIGQPTHVQPQQYQQQPHQKQQQQQQYQQQQPQRTMTITDPHVGPSLSTALNDSFLYHEKIQQVLNEPPAVSTRPTTTTTTTSHYSLNNALQNQSHNTPQRQFDSHKDTPNDQNQPRFNANSATNYTNVEDAYQSNLQLKQHQQRDRYINQGPMSSSRLTKTEQLELIARQRNDTQANTHYGRNKDDHLTTLQQSQRPPLHRRNQRRRTQDYVSRNDLDEYSDSGNDSDDDYDSTNDGINQNRPRKISAGNQHNQYSTTEYAQNSSNSHYNNKNVRSNKRMNKIQQPHFNNTFTENWTETRQQQPKRPQKQQNYGHGAENRNRTPINNNLETNNYILNENYDIGGSSSDHDDNYDSILSGPNRPGSQRNKHNDTFGQIYPGVYPNMPLYNIKIPSQSSTKKNKTSKMKNKFVTSGGQKQPNLSAYRLDGTSDVLNNNGEQPYGLDQSVLSNDPNYFLREGQYQDSNHTYPSIERGRSSSNYGNDRNDSNIDQNDHTCIHETNNHQQTPPSHNQKQPYQSSRSQLQAAGIGVDFIHKDQYQELFAQLSNEHELNISQSTTIKSNSPNRVLSPTNSHRRAGDIVGSVTSVKSVSVQGSDQIGLDNNIIGADDNIQNYVLNSTTNRRHSGSRNNDHQPSQFEDTHLHQHLNDHNQPNNTVNHNIHLNQHVGYGPENTKSSSALNHNSHNNTLNTAHPAHVDTTYTNSVPSSNDSRGNPSGSSGSSNRASSMPSSYGHNTVEKNNNNDTFVQTNHPHTTFHTNNNYNLDPDQQSSTYKSHNTQRCSDGHYHQDNNNQNVSVGIDKRHRFSHDNIYHSAQQAQTNSANNNLNNINNNSQHNEQMRLLPDNNDNTIPQHPPRPVQLAQKHNQTINASRHHHHISPNRITTLDSVDFSPVKPTNMPIYNRDLYYDDYNDVYYPSGQVKDLNQTLQQPHSNQNSNHQNSNHQNQNNPSHHHHQDNTTKPPLNKDTINQSRQLDALHLLNNPNIDLNSITMDSIIDLIQTTQFLLGKVHQLEEKNRNTDSRVSTPSRMNYDSYINHINQQQPNKQSNNSDTNPTNLKDIDTVMNDSYFNDADTPSKPPINSTIELDTTVYRNKQHNNRQHSINKYKNEPRSGSSGQMDEQYDDNVRKDSGLLVNSHYNLSYKDATELSNMLTEGGVAIRYFNTLYTQCFQYIDQLEALLQSLVGGFSNHSQYFTSLTNNLKIFFELLDEDNNDQGDDGIDGRNTIQKKRSSDNKHNHVQNINEQNNDQVKLIQMIKKLPIFSKPVLDTAIDDLNQLATTFQLSEILMYSAHGAQIPSNIIKTQYLEPFDPFKTIQDESTTLSRILNQNNMGTMMVSTPTVRRSIQLKQQGTQFTNNKFNNASVTSAIPIQIHNPSLLITNSLQYDTFQGVVRKLLTSFDSHVSKLQPPQANLSPKRTQYSHNNQNGVHNDMNTIRSMDNELDHDSKLPNKQSRHDFYANTAPQQSDNTIRTSSDNNLTKDNMARKRRVNIALQSSPILSNPHTEMPNPLPSQPLSDPKGTQLKQTHSSRNGTGKQTSVETKRNLTRTSPFRPSPGHMDISSTGGKVVSQNRDKDIRLSPPIVNKDNFMGSPTFSPAQTKNNMTKQDQLESLRLVHNEIQIVSTKPSPMYAQHVSRNEITQLDKNNSYNTTHTQVSQNIVLSAAITPLSSQDSENQLLKSDTSPESSFDNINIDHMISEINLNSTSTIDNKDESIKKRMDTRMHVKSSEGVRDLEVKHNDSNSLTNRTDTSMNSTNTEAVMSKTVQPNQSIRSAAYLSYPTRDSRTNLHTTTSTSDESNRNSLNSSFFAIQPKQTTSFSRFYTPNRPIEGYYSSRQQQEMANSSNLNNATDNNTHNKNFKLTTEAISSVSTQQSQLHSHGNQYAKINRHDESVGNTDKPALTGDNVLSSGRSDTNSSSHYNSKTPPTNPNVGLLYNNIQLK